MRPSTDAVSATCGGGYLRFVAFIKVTFIYCDRQCLVVVVVFAIVNIALIEGECYDRRFVIDLNNL